MFGHARKLFLLGMAAAALTAPSASAQTLEVSQEANGVDTHCTSVTLTNHIPQGGCGLRVISESPHNFFQHTGAAEVAFGLSCSWIFEVRVDEAGNGFAYNQALTPEGGACAREPCDEGEGGPNPHRNLAWPVDLGGTGGGSSPETFGMTFCIYPHGSSGASEGGSGTDCEVELAVATLDHAYEFSTPAHDGAGNGGVPCVNTGGAVEFEGHFISQSSANHPDSIEIRHESPPEVSKESAGGGAHCTSVTLSGHIPSGNCNIRAISSEFNVWLYAHTGTSEVLFSVCGHDLEARFNEEGHGYVYNQQLTGANCGRSPCDEPGAGPNPHRHLPWEAEIEEPVSGPSQETLALTLCLRSSATDEGGAGGTCRFVSDLTSVGHAHEFSTPPADLSGNGGAQCVGTASIVEVVGHWVSAPNANHPDDIEVLHTE